MAIQAFNQQLVLSCESKYDILDYVKKVNKLSNNPIEDLSFMEELMDYIQYDECVVPHMLLVKYGVISGENSNNISNDVKRLLKQYRFELDTDFKHRNVAVLESNGKTYHKKEYMLHPDTFKLCLSRAKNTNVYAKYYLLLEKSIKYYHEYQLMYKDKLLSMKDDKIDEQSRKIDEQSRKIDELLSHTKDVKHDLACMVDLALEQVEENELHKIKLEKAVPDRINNPIDLNSVEHLVLFNIGQDKYYVIRGTSAYIKTKFKRLTNVTYSNKDSTTSNTEYVYVKTYNDVPNSRHLYRILKEHYNIAHGNMNSFTSNVPVNDLTEIIQEVFDKRLTVDIGSREKTKVKTIAKSKVSKTLTN